MTAIFLDLDVLRAASPHELVDLMQAVLDEEGAAGVADVVAVLLAGGYS